MKHAQMQRRHFEHIAQTIKDAFSDQLDEQYREHIALCFAISLNRTNANFRPGKFLIACGLSSERAIAVASNANVTI